MKIIRGKETVKVPFSSLSPGDVFNVKSLLCMKIVVPKRELGLSDEDVYTVGWYVNLYTNRIGEISPDAKVEFVNAAVVLVDEVEEN